jgi:hypothetical protein
MRVVEMDVRVILNVFSFWVIGDVEELIVVVARICDAMRVVAVLPNLSGEIVANGEGKASPLSVGRSARWSDRGLA